MNMKSWSTVNQLLQMRYCVEIRSKDLYYNRNNKKGKPIETDNLAPILVGNSYGYCRGKFYDKTPSILITEDDVEKDIMNEM